MDMTLTEKESWKGLSEAEICQKIVTERPGYKVIVSQLTGGLTRAIMAATIEAGVLSDKDLIILTPTIEDLGLLQVPDVKTRWDRAVKNATDQRALNIARRVKRADTVEALEEAADTAMAAAVEEAVKGLRVYFIVDKSSSMHTAIGKAKDYATKLLAGFPLDKFHLAVFNSRGKELTVKHASRGGIEQAFRGENANGYTDYGAGVLALQHHKPHEDEDALIIFVGDQGQRGTFTQAVQRSGLNPVAFAMVDVERRLADRVVEDTARELGIPCFALDEAVVAGDDPYAKVRTLRNLILAAPVATGQVMRPYVYPKRKSLIEIILETELLQKPVWAEA
jgi:flavin-binding protein dodecin